MSRQSVAKAHQKIQELSWEPQYHQPVSQYGTDYTFPKAQKKDPLKQVLRSYFPMQEEKDHRVYGAQDGAIRGNMFRQVQERWLEWQKLFLSIIPLPEISRRAGDAAAVPHGSQPGAAQRPGDPDDRRGTALDDPAEPQAPVHEQLHRPGRVQLVSCGTSRTTTAARSAVSSPRASSPATRSPRRDLPHDRRRDGVHQHPVRRHARRGRGQRRLPAADGVPLGAVGRVAAHQQRLRDAADGAVRREQPPAARARPALRLVEQPPGGGRGHRHVHRVRHQGPA